MKEQWKRNAVVATVLLFVCAAVYLNWRYAGNVTGDAAPAGTQTLAGSQASGGGQDGGTETEDGKADGGSTKVLGDAALVGYEPVNFREEVDVLIIGSGYAGLAAAMAPALAGKSIAIIENQGQIGGDSAPSCCFMFANGTELQQAAGNPVTIDEYWEASAERLSAGWDEYPWFGDWVKGKTYANTRFVDSAINDFGAKFQEPCTEAELPRLFGSVILPGDGIGSGGPNILQPIAAKLG